MNKKCEIKYSPLFYNDLEKITDYIKNKLNNVIAANNLLNEIEKEIEKRRYNPSSYEKFLTNKKRKYIYYRIYVKRYIIFYIVEDNVMEVKRIIYRKRNMERLI